MDLQTHSRDKVDSEEEDSEGRAGPSCARCSDLGGEATTMTRRAAWTEHSTSSRDALCPVLVRLPRRPKGMGSEGFTQPTARAQDLR